eukprot:scaffold16981_cov122-Isochrysis_galbana.AAC.3
MGDEWERGGGVTGRYWTEVSRRVAANIDQLIVDDAATANNQKRNVDLYIVQKVNTNTHSVH